MPPADDRIDDAPPDPALAPTQTSGGTNTSSGAVIAPPAPAGDESMLRAGDMVDRYRVEGFLGRGGMGVVYRARDLDLDRALAIKLVRSSQRGGDRMLREAQAMARLDHPNVVPIFDVGMREQQVFLAMPFLAGGTLGEWCRKEARPWREVVTRYIAAGRGLEAAHGAGIVHRDFKPDNVLVTSKGDVQVADFGLARAHQDDSADGGVEVAAISGPLNDALTRDGELLGTPAYMAPEQIDGKTVDARADQFSFCVALHEGLYGVRPFDPPKGGGIAAQRAAIADGRVRPPPADRDVPTWLRDVILRGLSEDPAARWPSMNALLATLERGVTRSSRIIPIVVVGTIVVAAAATIGYGVLDMPSPSRVTPPPPPPTTAPIAPSERALVPRQVTSRGDIWAGQLAPDDSAVLARTDNEILIIPVAGGEPRTLVRDASKVVSAAWAPDSKHVMTTYGTGGDHSIVRLYDVITGDHVERELTAWPLAAMIGPREVASAHPATRVVFLTSFDDVVAVKRCAIPGDFTFIESLESAAGALFVITLNADDTTSVVRTDRNCTKPQLVLAHVKSDSVVVDHDGAAVGVLRTIDGKRVIEWTAVAGRASISPPLPDDLATIAGRTATGALVGIRGNVNWQLVRVGGAPGRILDVIGSGSKPVTLAVSPDGKKVARLDTRQAEQRVLRVTPTEAIDALPEPIASDVRDFAWSPDGTRIAALIDHGKDTALAVVDATGGPIREIPLPQRPNGSLVWIDDQRVAFQRSDNQTFLALDLESHETKELLDPTAGWAIHLVVNRIDETLAVMWNRAPEQGIYLIRPGRDPELVVGTTDVGLPEWSPDGRTLWYFSGNAIGRYDVHTKQRRAVFETQERALEVTAVWPQADGTVLTELARTSRDLYVFE